MRKVHIVLLFMIALAVMFISCGKKAESNSATVIIVGRHANANAFADAYYNAVENHVRDAFTSGGFVRVVICDGNPKPLDNKFDFLKEYEPDPSRRVAAIEDEVLRVMTLLKDESVRAISPETDLLQSLHVARRLFNELEDFAKNDNKKIQRKQIIIMDTGIVTTGALNFTTHDVENFYFDVSDEEIREITSQIATRLSNDRALPDLQDVHIVFLGFGDVAMPQRQLSPNVKNGIKILWETVFEKSNVDIKHVDIKDYESSHRPNIVDFPPVRVLDFSEYGWTVKVDFDFGKSVYNDSAETKERLVRFATFIDKFLYRNPGVILHVVGSESNDRGGTYSHLLSEQRALTVADTLSTLGIPMTKMNVFGLAIYFPGRENDRPNGIFNSEIGAKNQKVMIIPSNIKNQSFLQEVLSERNKLYGNI